MSSKLISQQNWQQDFRDDLESSIYVLLWVTLMYSGCSDQEHVAPFMEGVLDPQPHCGGGGLGKADFLQGKSFLKQVSFPNRPALHGLIDHLAGLFAVRYEREPDIKARERFQQALFRAQDQPEQRDFLYEISDIAWYDQRVNMLKGHEATIELFDKALADHSQWPAADGAVKQDIYTNTRSRRPASQMLKTGWSTTLIIREMDSDYDSSDVDNEEDPFQIVNADTSSETTDSDQMTAENILPSIVDADISSETADPDQMTAEDNNSMVPSIVDADIRGPLN
jgi:hypothetical protein